MSAGIPACSHRPPCPGCPRYGENGIAPEARRRLAEFAKGAGLRDPALMEGPLFAYRHRARLSVRGRSASPKIGIFQQGSHRIVDIPSCRVHHPAINHVAAALKAAIRKTDTLPYADAPHLGALRSIQVVVERSSQNVQLVLVGNAKSPDPLRPLMQELIESLGVELQGLWWNGNDERTNVVLGREWERIAGSPAVKETIGGAEVFFPPGAFGQANLGLADSIVERIHAWVRPDATVLELYAGCGAIGLGLARRGQEITFNELSPDSLLGLEMGLAALPPGTRNRTRISPGPASESASLLEEADVLIADPPRKGLDQALLDTLARSPPDQFIYLSCSADSFVRDGEALLARRRLSLARLEAYALFPGTDHVEILALFERSPGAAARSNLELPPRSY